MEGRKIPFRRPSKCTDASLTHAHEVSLVLYNLMKEGTLRKNMPNVSNFSGEMAKGKVSLE